MKSLILFISTPACFYSFTNLFIYLFTLYILKLIIWIFRLLFIFQWESICGVIINNTLFPGNHLRSLSGPFEKVICLRSRGPSLLCPNPTSIPIDFKIF